VARRQREEDVAQGPRAARQRARQREERRWQVLPDARQQERVVLALQRVGRVLPVDCGREERVSRAGGEAGGAREGRRTHYRCR